MERPTHALLNDQGEIDQIVFTDGLPEGSNLIELPSDYWLKPMLWIVADQSFVENVELVRDTKWAIVKARRDQAECGGCSTLYGRVDTNEAAKLNLNGAVTMAQIALSSAQSFSIQWTMADNSIVTLDANQMIVVGVAVGQHVNACHDVARQLREQIAAATSIVDIEAIDVEAAGWPS